MLDGSLGRPLADILQRFSSSQKNLLKRFMTQKKILPSTRRSFQIYRIFVVSLCGKYACMYLFVCDQIDQNVVFECKSIFVAIRDSVGGNFSSAPYCQNFARIVEASAPLLPLAW